MIKPEWNELALAGLRRELPVEKIESARSAIDLKLMLSPTGLRRHPAFDREIYVFTQFAGKTLRIVVEIATPTIIWHLGVQPDLLTE